MSIKCENCGFTLGENDKSCPRCGATNGEYEYVKLIIKDNVSDEMALRFFDVMDNENTGEILYIGHPNEACAKRRNQDIRIDVLLMYLLLGVIYYAMTHIIHFDNVELGIFVFLIILSVPVIFLLSYTSKDIILASKTYYIVSSNGVYVSKNGGKKFDTFYSFNTVKSTNIVKNKQYMNKYQVADVNLIFYNGYSFVIENIEHYNEVHNFIEQFSMRKMTSQFTDKK